MSAEQMEWMRWLADQFGSVRERLSAIETRLTAHDKRGRTLGLMGSLPWAKLLPWVVVGFALLTGLEIPPLAKSLLGLPAGH